MSSERRLDVLRAIVEDYVTTREPVGSKLLAERHSLGVSPATIRNDMAALEEEGLIAQPHTSAGRVPTDRGYRLFVDQLAEVKPLSRPERRAISVFLDQAVDLDDVIFRASRLLAHLTQQVAVVQYPSLRRSGLRHLELVPVPGSRLLVVIITDTGRVEQRTLSLSEDVDEALIAIVRGRLNAAVLGRRLPEIREALPGLLEQFDETQRPLVQEIFDLLADTLAEETEERIVLSGASNLARSDAGLESSLRPVLEALEEEVVLLGLLTEMSEDSRGVAVRIGHETQHAGLSVTSVVSTGYGTEGDSVALLGSIGPTRMDYPGTIASVRAVARYLTRILAT
ncbi:heat-inducible transcriptional repressor HrcA [Sanguibacter hominis ATCC BAA-789]|uniref:Heat-inducible transcription repressor HrcA n=1 Tax=Sanguibacter hominis ATCC BAA-789 TaxID=1312740 RepID=A0A9X5IQU9_9MICO|nr:heat-inducible transcriptional repressor HrcA [Sanguibacter hominis]NKX93065.1 heat-inducible transcriptional repressor HrcA [Sanguibacter hominis ATCC BAA-789]